MFCHSLFLLVKYVGIPMHTLPAVPEEAQSSIGFWVWELRQMKENSGFCVTFLPVWKSVPDS